MRNRRNFTLFSCLWLAACGSATDIPGETAGEVYVIPPADKASRFTNDLAPLVKRYGLTPNLGQATDDKGYSLYVLEATSPSVRLWSQNILLSGHEDPERCGVYSEPHSDPGQYFIAVSPSTQKIDPRDARALLVKIVRDLKDRGYDVRPEPILCSNLSAIASKG